VTTDTPTPKIKNAFRLLHYGLRWLFAQLAYAGTFVAYVAIFAVFAGALLWVVARGDLTFGECVAFAAMLAFAVSLVARVWAYTESAWEVAAFVSHLVRYGVQPVNDHDEKARAREEFNDGLRSIDEYRPLMGNTATLAHQESWWPPEELVADVAKEVSAMSGLAAGAVSHETIKANAVTVGKIDVGTVLTEPDRSSDDDSDADPARTT